MKDITIMPMIFSLACRLFRALRRLLNGGEFAIELVELH